MSVQPALLMVIFSALSQVPPAANDGDRQERLQFMKTQGAELAFFHPDRPDASLVMAPEPVLRYSNPLGLGQTGDGITLLWLEGTRPMVAASYSIRPPKDDVYLECTSFSANPLTCRQQDQTIWSPKTGGLIAQRIDDAPAPAASKPQRLTQMREIARRFSAKSYTQTDEPTELRLLTTPLYRFAAEDSGVLDGGLFALVVSNDPEQFVLLEAVRAAGGGPAHWQFTLARMCSRRLSIRLDDKEIWSVGNFYREPAQDRKSGPYFEMRLGNFAPTTGKP